MSAYFVDDSPFIEHIGTKFHSGRYPYGSGENPYQHDAKAFRARVSELRTDGLSDTEIARYFGISTKELRPMLSYSEHEIRAEMVEQCERLRKKGLSKSEIARRLGIADTSVASYLNEKSKAKMLAATKAAEFLKDQVDSKGLIDVGAGTNVQLNIPQERLDEALFILKNEGYTIYKKNQKQMTNPGQYTPTMVLCPPGTKYSEIYNGEIKGIEDYVFQDGEEPRKKWVYPQSIDSKRVMVKYAEEGGLAKDGLIEIRPGVEDLSLGESAYAQVRILVDGSHYIKGMAAYSNNLPEGVDIVFNTRKEKGTPMCGDDKNNTVFKKIKDDPEDPFGSLLKEGGQHEYIGADGKKHLSVINKTREEGDWAEWSKELPSQFLAKQNKHLIDRQLNLTIAEQQDEFASIMEVTQPNVRKKLLWDFAQDCDARACTLKATALPGQVYKVILPVSTIKDNECYAPDMKNGEQVALIRFPHGGTFEIPILTVNNNNKEAKEVYGNASDGIGISKKAADQLSGADFDGDTVIRIPLRGSVVINSKHPLKQLEGFDPITEYPAVPGMKLMTKRNTQTEMGKVSNLIADMTVKGAPDDEIAMAVKHSMVVIDAEKHKLNWKASEVDNHIDMLKRKWQAHLDDEGYGGASTLLTKANSDEHIPKRKGAGYINAETGEMVYREDPDRFYVDKKGKTQQRTITVPKMSVTKDAHSLSSGTPVEEAYAEYANALKSMANNARLEYKKIKFDKVSKSASEIYKKEVAELEEGVRLAELNRPRERQAQRLADSTMAAKKASNPHMTKEEEGKEATKALANARLAVGAKRQTIKLSDRQWEAIQSGACSGTFLNKVFLYVDADDLRKRATPKKSANVDLTETQISRIKAMSNSGYTLSEIAEGMGISPSSVSKYLKS